MKALFISFLFSSAALATDTQSIISGWLSHQTNIQSWSADFTQTRNLKGLAQPLVSTGQVWFAAPQNFRWELGGDHTIAIRSNETMLVVYPRLKRAETYRFDSSTRSEWKDTLALLQSGFPRSKAELDQQFNPLSINESTLPGELVELQLEPKSPGARKMMPRIHVLLTTNLTLAGTELVFVDGSRMRNEFSNIRTNVDPTGKFNLTVPSDFKLVEPMKGAGR
jgi:outer membrane lipoprotein-sorting protein